MRPDLRALGAVALAAVCWGLAPVATRSLALALHPLHILILRAALSLLAFLPLLLHGLKGLRQWPRAERIRAVLCGLTGLVGYSVPVTYGARWLPAGITGLIIASEPIWIVLLSLLLAGARLDWGVAAGLVLAASGVGALLVSGNSVVAHWEPLFAAGAGLTLFGAMMWAVYSVALGPLSRSVGALQATAVSTAVGTLPLLALSDRALLHTAANLGATAWLLLAFLALGSQVLATILWGYGLARLPASQAGLFLYLIPLVSVIGGHVALHEPVGIGVLASGAAIVCGVAVAQVAARPAAAVRRRA